MNEFGQHQDSKGQEMQSLQGIWQAFVITGQATKAGHPAKGTLDDPSTRQQHKALFGAQQLDNEKLNALVSGSLCWRVAGIALIDKRHRDALPRRL